MQAYTRWLGKKFKSIFMSFLLLFGISSLALVVGEEPLPARVAIGLGAFTSLVAWIGPLLYIQAKNIKIKSPKPRFIEPRLLILVPLILISWIFTFILLVVINGLIGLGDILERELENETILGYFYMSFFFFSSAFAPLSIYMIWITTRYKKIVEYGSSEWYKQRKHK